MDNFKKSVKHCSALSDYEQYEYLLSAIDPMYYDSFVRLLKLGSCIYGAYVSIDLIKKIERKSPLTQVDIIDLMFDFHHLLMYSNQVKPIV